MDELILNLVLNNYKLVIQSNKANPRYVAITMSKDGVNVRGNVVIDKWNTDQACGAIVQLKSVIDQRLKGHRR